MSIPSLEYITLGSCCSVAMVAGRCTCDIVSYWDEVLENEMKERKEPKVVGCS